MKVKRFLIALGIAIVLLLIGFNNKTVYAANAEPNWYGGCYSTQNPYTNGYAGQCTWYVYGRALELTGKNIGFTGWAGGYWDGVNSSFQRSQTPRENAIVCWSGHVAWVEAVNGDQVTISECNYTKNTDAWYTSVDQALNNGQYDGRHTMSSEAIKSWPGGQAFKGYIYIGDAPTPARPEITQCFIEMHSITSSSYKVKVYFNAPGGINRVVFPTWTVANGQDDLDKNWNSNIGKCCGKKESDGGYSFTVRQSDHNYEKGMYATHIYIYDNYGQEASTAFAPVPMGSTVQNLGNFTARISLKNDSSKVIGIASKSQGADVVLKNKNYNDNSQLWKFTRKSDGAYVITNVSTGYVLDVNNSINGGLDNYAKLGIYSAHGGTNQDFYPMNYNGGIRLVTRASRDWKAVDLNGNNVKEGEIIQQYEAQITNNAAQTWVLEKVATNLSVSPTNITMTFGETKQLNVSITPSNTAIKNYKVSGSNNVATISTSGLITAKKAGTAVLSVSTADGSNLSKKIYVTVKDGAKSLKNVNGTWYYTNNGFIDTSYTGLVYYNKNWYYVQKGILKWGVETLVQYNGTWYYVKNSTLDWNYTGLCQYNGSWYYIQKGTLKWGVETLVQYKGTWYYVNNSTLDWNYTGLCLYNGSWYYVQRGTLKWGVETLVQYKGTWYYVKNSTLDWNYTGLCQYNGSWYYIQKGTLKWGYNGMITYNGKKYQIKNSTVV